MGATTALPAKSERQAAKTPRSSSSDEECAIEVDDITVRYRSYKERPGTLKENILRAVKERRFRYYSTFEALSDVSFKVSKGEILGIIGSNGAGKSTLLSVLAGVLRPAKGKVITRGSVDSLRSLGAGFDAELNAVENIYLYGSLHGRSREEMQERVPSILKFAELEEFASTPIRYYSSGMYARLGFSVAIDTDPDILLVDEVLAVGDERFQKKCRRVFEDFLSIGKTIVMVSHGMEFMERISTEIALLSRGKLIYKGCPKTAVELYRNTNYQTVLRGA